MDLFDKEAFINKNPARELIPSKDAPLAKRICPVDLADLVGQPHLLGEGKLLRRLIESDRLVSIILYGPPGTGKTALCNVIAHRTGAYVERLNATLAGVEEVRNIIRAAKERAQYSSQRTILFVDEIHRFNKAQQDAFLPDVEGGTIILLGCTTQNPFFSINPALLSRSQIFEFKPLSEGELRSIIQKALRDKENGLGNLNIKIQEEAIRHLLTGTEGDARQLLNALEVGTLTTDPDKDGRIYITVAVAEECLQKKRVIYDSNEDSHYDTISAFIKSLRGSDPDAALYWMAKMLYAGEDPRFIARRLVIAAAEDVGNADPRALQVATAAFQALEWIGLPEARIPLAQAVTYIACAPKSNASCVGIDRAWKDVSEKPLLSVPNHLRDAHYKGAKKLGRGEGYIYPHEDPLGYVEQNYLPEKKTYYVPKEVGYESILKKRLEDIKKYTKSKNKQEEVK